MTATKKRGPRKAAPKKPKPLSRQQLLERDPWHFRRQEPVFKAIMQVLIDHPDVCYYGVDWRPWLQYTKAPPGKPTRREDPACGSMSLPYNAGLGGGGGYLERFAQGVIDMLGGIVVTLPDGTERALDRSCGGGVDPRDDDEYRRWRRLPNGIDVWVRKYKAGFAYPSGAHYKAMRGDVHVGSLGLGGPSPSGHIAGLYSYVQGNDAPCTTPEAWVAELARLTVKPGPQTVSEAVWEDLRQSYRFETDGQARIAAQDNRWRRKQGKPLLRPTPRWGFERLMRECGFNKRLLARFDREVERQRKLAAREAARQAKTNQPQEDKCKPKSRSRSGSRTVTRSKAGSAKRATTRSSPKRRVSATKTSSTSRAAGRRGASTSSRAKPASRAGQSSPNRRTTLRTAPLSPPKRSVRSRSAR